MLPDPSLDIPAKPRVLIADDSRIVRATLIKHIQGMFEFREALDGEEAWETLLIDPSIRVVITDLTMPKLDGYGLLSRIRGSEIARIRNLPVVVVSGSDEREERERAIAAGATDLIVKGIGTAQLLSKLDILAKLANTQRDFERSLEVLVRNATVIPTVELTSSNLLLEQAEIMLSNALKQDKHFFILHVKVGLKHAGLTGNPSAPPKSVVDAIGQLLQRTIRQTDCVAQVGEAEFSLAAGSVTFDSAHNFAQRLCSAVVNANLVRDDQMKFIASCGLASLAKHSESVTSVASGVVVLIEAARRRAVYGLHHGITGVIGESEELAIQENRHPDFLLNQQSAAAPSLASANQSVNQSAHQHADTPPPDLATLLEWIKEGKQDLVMQHIDKLSVELQPLVDLMLKQTKQ